MTNTKLTLSLQFLVHIIFDDLSWYCLQVWLVFHHLELLRIFELTQEHQVRDGPQIPKAYKMMYSLSIDLLGPDCGEPSWPKITCVSGLPWWSSGSGSTCQWRGRGFNYWSGKIPHTTEQLSLCITTAEAHVPRAHDPQQGMTLQWRPNAAKNK